MTAPQLDLLSNGAAGLFVCATATIEFLDGGFRAPSKLYTTIADYPDNTIHEGEVEGVHAVLNLDSLCISVFIASFGSHYLKSPRWFPLRRKMRWFPCGWERYCLKSISSLLEVHKDNDHPVCLFHKLLFYYLINPECCKDKQFVINTSGNPSGKTI